MRTIREGQYKKAIVRLLEHKGSYTGVVITENSVKVRITGDDADDVWRRLHIEAATTSPSFFGFDGARARFLKIFPEGFAEPAYRERERDYKVAAHKRLNELVSPETAATGSAFGETILSMFRATNLLFPIEKTRMQNVLRGSTGDDFVRGAARFTLGDIKDGLVQMKAALEPHDVAKWTVVTYLPYLWRPEQHMMLKPQVTCDFAERVGHRFAVDYSPELVPSVYEALLDLTQTTTREIAALEPADHIDIQSFVWVVGAYGKDEEGEQRAEEPQEA